MNAALIVGTIGIWLAAVLGMFLTAVLLAFALALFTPPGPE